MLRTMRGRAAVARRAHNPKVAGSTPAPANFSSPFAIPCGGFMSLNYDDLTSFVLELIRKSSTDLPIDVEMALKSGHQIEKDGSLAKSCFEGILKNIENGTRKTVRRCVKIREPTFILYHYR